jgi:F-type H+-transporting ATPase subunit b
MSLLSPETGLLFWMLLSFGTVFFILSKYGFPIIVKMVENRRAYIQKSLDDAKDAKAHMENLKAESNNIIATAREEQIRILREANHVRESIINSAKQEAKEITVKQIEETRKEIIKERDSAIKNIRAQIALLSVDIAEKVIRAELQKTPAQMDMINRFLEETSDLKS